MCSVFVMEDWKWDSTANCDYSYFHKRLVEHQSYFCGIALRPAYLQEYANVSLRFLSPVAVSCWPQILPAVSAAVSVRTDGQCERMYYSKPKDRQGTCTLI